MKLGDAFFEFRARDFLYIRFYAESLLIVVRDLFQAAMKQVSRGNTGCHDNNAGQSDNQAETANFCFHVGALSWTEKRRSVAYSPKRIEPPTDVQTGKEVRPKDESSRTILEVCPQAVNRYSARGKLSSEYDDTIIAIITIGAAKLTLLHQEVQTR